MDIMLIKYNSGKKNEELKHQWNWSIKSWVQNNYQKRKYVWQGLKSSVGFLPLLLKWGGRLMYRKRTAFGFKWTLLKLKKKKNYS